MQCFFFSSPEATPILQGIFFNSSKVRLIRLLEKELLTASPDALKKQVHTSPTAPFFLIQQNLLLLKSQNDIE